MGRRKKTNDDGTKRKCGNQGKYYGPRLQFLQSHLPAYREAHSYNKTREFWRPLLEEYCKQFDWKEDYELGLAVIKSKPSDALNGDDAELALQQEVKQATTLVRTSQVKRSKKIKLTHLCLPEYKELVQLPSPNGCKR